MILYYFHISTMQFSQRTTDYIFIYQVNINFEAIVGSKNCSGPLSNQLEINNMSICLHVSNTIHHDMLVFETK